MPPPDFDKLFMSMTSTFSVNWPHAPEMCFVSRRRHRSSRGVAGGGEADGCGGSQQQQQHDINVRLDDGGEPGAPADDDEEDEQEEDLVLDLAPEFERHVRDLSNWTLGREFADAFPQWRDCVFIQS